MYVNGCKCKLFKWFSNHNRHVHGALLSNSSQNLGVWCPSMCKVSKELISSLDSDWNTHAHDFPSHTSSLLSFPVKASVYNISIACISFQDFHLLNCVQCLLALLITLCTMSSISGKQWEKNSLCLYSGMDSMQHRNGFTAIWQNAFMRTENSLTVKAGIMIIKIMYSMCYKTLIVSYRIAKIANYHC